MVHQFAVEIARSDPGTPSVGAFSVTFRRVGVRGVEHLRRCRSEYALMRLIEDLLTDPDSRLRLLERLRAEGRASISRVVLSDSQVAQYGLGGSVKPRGSASLCPLCLQGVGAVDRVVFLDGEAIHDECRVKAREMAEYIGQFLQQNVNRAFCHSCLSRLFNISFAETRKVVGQLQVQRRYSVAPMSCSVCTKLRVTIRAVPPDDPTREVTFRPDLPHTVT